MMQKTTKVLSVSSTLLLLSALTVFVIFLYLVSSQKKEFITLTVEHAQAEDHYHAVSSLVRTLEETEEERAEVFSRILREENVIEFLALIETIGKEQGVALTTNTLIVEPINESFDTLVMNISVSGPYAAVMRTLQIVETLPYHSTIQKFRLSQEEGVEAWTSTYDVRITTFKKNEL